MRQRNDIEVVSIERAAELPADHRVKFCHREQLRDGELADGNDQAGLENFDLTLQPTRTVLNLLIARHTVAAGGFLPGKQRQTAAM